MSTNRIEAFSDGVIAIIITIMVFDLKIPDLNKGLTSGTFWLSLKNILPQLISYALSFLMLAVMWVNHHQLFQQLNKINPIALWLNIHLLFWMSLIPFATNLIGTNSFLPEAVAFYAFIFLLNASSFWWLRRYAHKTQLFQSDYANTQNKLKHFSGIFLYSIAAASAFLSVYIAFICLLIVPVMYFIPE